jgi:hypothetical protein
MRLLPARDLLCWQARGSRLVQLAASIALSACTVSPAGSSETGNAANPSLSEPASEELDASAPEPSVPDPDLKQDADDPREDDGASGDGEATDRDAGAARAGDAQADADGAPMADGERNRADRCRRGTRSTIALSVAARVDRTVAVDDRFIYYRSLVNESPMRHEISALPRALLADPTPAPMQTTILRDDYALGPLVDGGDLYLFFIAMPRGDETNQGLFRVQKRERAGIESIPIHAQASDDYWPGQLALDESSFYLASSGPSSHSLRILRFARAGYQREVLWSSAGEDNDDDALGGLSLREGDIAVDANYVYFTLRVNQSRPPHDFRVYRLNKQGPNQTPLLVTTLTGSYGALASDGTHLFFSEQNDLEQLHLASGTRERLARQESMRDLSYADGVLSWTPVASSDANLIFFCL